MNAKNKSTECCTVLQMLDADFSYKSAIDAVCFIFKCNKTKLETELNNYI